MANTVDNRTWNMKNRNFQSTLDITGPHAHTSPMVVDSDQQQQRSVDNEAKVSGPGEEWCSKLLNYYRDLHKFPIEIFYFPIPSRGPVPEWQWQQQQQQQRYLTVKHVLLELDEYLC